MEGNMLRFFYLSPRHFAADLAITAMLFCTASTALAQSTEKSADVPVGRLNFEAASLPAANVEIDLNQDMFRDLFGIGDAALAGIADSLAKAASDVKGQQQNKGPEMAAQQLEAARQIVQLAGDVIREVHVRVYEDLPEDIGSAEALFTPFETQLRENNWETLARVRKDDELARVAVIRNGGAVQGIFLVATDGNGIVVANVVCDISPDNVKQLTSAATKIGLENGLGKELERKFAPQLVIQSADGATITIPAKPPTPPAPPVPVNQ
jgi:hypothetical protein